MHLCKDVCCVNVCTFKMAIFATMVQNRPLFQLVLLWASDVAGGTYCMSGVHAAQGAPMHMRKKNGDPALS